MKKQYYLVVIDMLMMFVIVLMIALMSISFENDGKSNTNYNSIESLTKTDSLDDTKNSSHVAIKLYTDKLGIYQVTSAGKTFVQHYYDLDSFASSNIYERSSNFVLFDDNKSPFFGDLIRTLNREGKVIFLVN